MQNTKCPDDSGSKFSGLRIQDEVFKGIVDRMNSYVFISELDTCRILFMNKTMKTAFGLEHPEGCRCWEVLPKSMTGPCPFCPVAKLDRNGGDQSSYIWEQYDAESGRIYENYDSLIPWTDGALVHIQYSSDVTQIRHTSEAASHDELTGLLNRRAGKEILQSRLDMGCPFTLCMLDVNNLKTVNDLYGHQAGDRLLLTVANALKEQMNTDDCLFRLSGDEFVALLDRTDRSGAIRRMEAVLSSLRETPEEMNKFCYGVAEAAAGTEHTMQALLSHADADLYTQKRSLHIRRAAEKLLSTPQTAQAASSFAYDESLLYDAILKSTDDYLYVCNMKTGVFRYSQAMVEEFALPGQVIENAAAVWGAKIHPLDKAAFLETNQDIADGRTESHCVEYRAQNRNGEWLWMRCRGHLERDKDGVPSLFAGFITNLGKKNKIDQLTGLPNRLAFEEECEHLLNAGFVTLLLFGIDDLKHINSLYDHAFGDEVIRIVSQRIQSLLPSNAQIFRLDGDEFGVLLRGEHQDLARRLYHSVQNAFGSQQTYDGRKFFCTLSCGCALSDPGKDDYLSFCKRSHLALDYAKYSGKNRMEFYRPEIMIPLTRNLELTELLRESIEKDFEGFRIFCQPVFRLDRSLYGAEALCRWSCDKYGNVPPGEFIPLLEKSGQINKAGRFIYREAIRQCSLYQRLKPDFRMSINLSIIQMDDPSLVDYLIHTVEEYHVNPRYIILELTENCLAANLEQLNGLLEQLRSFGFSIAMDDFGTGYSSLGLLKQAPVDIVKLDYMFVQGILENQFDLAFIRMTVELCHIVGIQVCLEGVETEDEYGVINALGLDYLQGFLLGRPCESEKFISGFLEHAPQETAR